MSEIDTTAPPRPNRRILVRLLRGFLVFVVLLVVIYLIADQILLRKVQRQREAFKERFGAVDFRDFIPERPAPEEDAGRIYLYAAGLMAKVDEEHGDWSMYDALTKGPEAFKARRGYESENGLPTPEELDTDVREKMAAMDQAFTFVAQAREMARGTFLESYEPVDMLPVLEEVRMLSRNVAAKAVFEAREGNVDAAASWLEAGVHLAAMLNDEPTLVVQMVRIALLELALASTEEVFNAVSEVVPLSDRYLELLDAARHPRHFGLGLVSEAAFAMSYPVPGPRLFWSINHSKSLEITGQIVDAVESPISLKRVDNLKAFAVETSRLSILHFVARMTVPNLIRSAAQQDQVTARCDFVKQSMQLRAWKVQHGVYPESLDVLTAGEATPLPLDPFSGEVYHYRREGDGFVLYSVGLDRKDEQGDKDSDVVWTCVR